MEKWSGGGGIEEERNDRRDALGKKNGGKGAKKVLEDQVAKNTREMYCLKEGCCYCGVKEDSCGGLKVLV